MNDEQRTQLNELTLREHQERLLVSSIKRGIRKAIKCAEAGKFSQSLEHLDQGASLVRTLIGD